MELRTHTQETIDLAKALEAYLSPDEIRTIQDKAIEMGVVTPHGTVSFDDVRDGCRNFAEAMLKANPGAVAHPNAAFEETGKETLLKQIAIAISLNYPAQGQKLGGGYSR